MKRKAVFASGLGALLIGAAVAFLAIAPNQSETSFEAIVQETVVMSDGETRLIVERTTEIYGDPLNSLHIGEETDLIDADGSRMPIEDLQPGVRVEVTLKDAFTEARPFYYPTVYEIKIMKGDQPS